MQPSLTIAAVTGHDGYTQNLVYAIEHSFQALQPRIADLYCLLVSPSQPAYLPDYIRHIATKPFSYLEYNLFMLYSLADLVETDFCLTVQDDGWVVDGNNWHDAFFAYDFIGAPISNQRITMRNGRICQRIVRGQEPVFPIQPDEVLYAPMNGGLSLRSRKLLRAPRQLFLPMHIMSPDKLSGDVVGLSWGLATQNEDIFLTVQYRDTLTAHGMVFAPDDVAAYFSTESLNGNAVFGVDVSQLLGMHTASCFSLTGKNQITFKKSIRWNNEIVTTPQNIASVPLFRWLLEKGYTLFLPNDLGE